MNSVASLNVDELAEAYVKLVLAVGRHDSGYVDAFYGPSEWRGEVENYAWSPQEIAERAFALVERIGELPVPSDSIESQRHQYLSVQARAVGNYAQMLGGKKFSFDEESKALYDAVAPVVQDSEYDAVLVSLEDLLPGTEPLAERYGKWQQQFFIPSDKVPEVFDVAVAEARRRTKQYITLLEQESFEIEYVTGYPWGAYNWYKGNAYSLIQVNIDFPIRIGNAISLAAHEGYPGHHVYNALLEDRLAKKRGWVEFSIYALYSPQSLIAEGTAEYGVALTFPKQDRVEFLRSELFPLAGLDSAKVDEYERVYEAFEGLSSASNQAARHYLDGHWSKEEFVTWHMRYLLVSRERAEKSLRFIESGRSYIINYDLGKKMVMDYMDRQGAPLDQPEKAWPKFEAMMSSPILPSGLM
jgi:hypothetical protein